MMSDKVKLATVWLDGCSGCHMSFLDIDERLLMVAEKADLVYSPLVDLKDFPEMADVTLIEGAVSSEEDYEKAFKDLCTRIIAEDDDYLEVVLDASNEISWKARWERMPELLKQYRKGIGS